MQAYLTVCLIMHFYKKGKLYLFQIVLLLNVSTVRRGHMIFLTSLCPIFNFDLVSFLFLPFKQK